ncbi:ABC transporter A, ABCA [Kipferlia bialata]|uniref:ABC transporter A, ABCA n=1 Tax=Kipferlia bialata TaxID=797122 RepID=A0A9K3GJ70_9EUKA|nr:ABC transporter A, ABCA [Kipferlia bialata]|eukprot:g6554.t1
MSIHSVVPLLYSYHIFTSILLTLRQRGILLAQFLFPLILSAVSLCLVHVAQRIQDGQDHPPGAVIEAHFRTDNGWAGGVIQVFEEETDRDQWGSFMGNQTHTHEWPTRRQHPYSGMWRNINTYGIGSRGDCIRNEAGHCVPFPNVSDRVFTSADTVDDYLYTQLQAANNAYSLEELLVGKEYIDICPNLVFIVDGSSNVYQYDMVSHRYTSAPDTIVTNYTIQIPTHVPYLTGMDNSYNLMGEPMLMVFEGVVSDIMLQGMDVEEHLLDRLPVFSTATRVQVTSFPVPMTPDVIAADLTFPLLAFTFTFVFVIHTSAILQEKEAGLRSHMRLAGMLSTPFYASWLTVCVAVSLTVFAVVYVVGVVTGESVYTESTPLAWVMLLVAWSVAVSGFSLLYTVCFQSTKTAILVAVVVLMVQAPLFQYADVLVDMPAWLRAWPFFQFFEGLGYLAPLGPSPSHVTFADMTEPSPRGVSFMYACLLLLGEGAACALLGMYLDSVLPIRLGGQGKHPLYLSRRKGEECSEESQTEQTPLMTDSKDVFETVSTEPYEEDEGSDVTGERCRVAALMGVDTLPPLVMASLRKEYPSTTGDPPSTAVHCTTLAVSKGECFGLLGENGSGKSTTLNMVCGVVQPTSGTAYVCGENVWKTTKGTMTDSVGVCPQHDRLHMDLTVREELVLYLRLRGQSQVEAQRLVTPLLKSVGLGPQSESQIATLSGGMQRRTSLAIALTGSPSVLLLDEPTSGLDPVTRMELWQTIPRVKGGRALVLTTHCMAEADALCDRVGIVVAGRLQCIGTPTSLCQRYALGYVLCFLHRSSVEQGVKNIAADTVTRDSTDTCRSTLLQCIQDTVCKDAYTQSGHGKTTEIIVPKHRVAGTERGAEPDTLTPGVLVDRVQSIVDTQEGIEDWTFADASLQELFVHVINQAHTRYRLMEMTHS